jgi:hypothetical protein
MPRSLQPLIQALDNQREALLDELEALDLAALRARPRPGAWSILEIVEHVVVAEEEALDQAFFTHPVAGPITLAQALRMDLLHLQIHSRQIEKLHPKHLHPNA